MRSIVIVPVLAVLLALGACVSGETKALREPVKMDLLVRASSAVNPDEQKRAAPIVVRIYELKNADTFAAADFFSLQEKDKTLLADDLIARDQTQLRPGESRIFRRTVDAATTTIGVIAAYRDLPNSVWRVTWPVPTLPSGTWFRSAPTLKLTVDLDATAIRITEAPQQKR
ncbi:type VI secretion system lipoprotein TssJ [Paraburkholderia sp. GAS199]|uniref:type VI secretion system lipoprotein TssJ n=1 Tax=Paraburkholderia sp. GAS199 TaxID=3035126 RepID=UPI003D1AC72E